MPETISGDDLAWLRRVAEDRFARPSERVAARKVLRELRKAEDAADRRELVAVLQRTVDRVA